MKKRNSKLMIGVLTLGLLLSIGIGEKVNAMQSDTKQRFTPIEVDSERFFTSGNGIALCSDEGDSYENNDDPSVATQGRYNLATYASIHSADEADWYEMGSLDTDQMISVILTNIPSGCDYDMYLVQYDEESGIGDVYANTSTGNTAEALVGYVGTAGTYYVVVQPNSEVENNFSDSNYKLYFGNTSKTKTFGYKSTGLSIDFGYVKTGNTSPVYKYWYEYDLTNSSSIPDGAIVKKIYLSSDGNGNSWVGFNKMLGYGNNRTLATKSGGIDLMYSAGDTETIAAKQRWLIGGYVTSSTYFVWQPKMKITYTFDVTLDTIRFVQ